MREVVISDTSCLIVLRKIGRLELLRQCYEEIIITEEIAREFKEQLPSWIVVEQPKDATLQKVLEQMLGKGESSAIALAFEKEKPLLILDDLRARKIAKSMNLQITGTLGVLVKAKEKGFIKKIKPVLEELQQTNFRASDFVIENILEVCGE
ncbi:MAG: DUF3368 domain-containing protein [Ignavibacteriales bacterium]|nr:DUF3368 domain-containing protein [Ignavibacteriales bacterium]